MTDVSHKIHFFGGKKPFFVFYTFGEDSMLQNLNNITCTYAAVKILCESGIAAGLA